MIIDFDSKFRLFLEDWMKSNADKFANVEDMETSAINLYEKWQNEPAEWLDRECPFDYFNKFDNPDELIEMICEYLNANIGVPDLLFDKLTNFGQDAKGALTKLFRLEYSIQKENLVEAQMLAINLLSEIDDTFLHEEYIGLLLDTGISSEIANLLIEKLKYADVKIINTMLDGLSTITNEEIETRCADVLVNFPGDKRIYTFLVEMFNKYTNNTSLLAAYLGKYGDDNAISILEKALNWLEINYLDYIEIRNSIEELGKEVEHMRSFEGDQYYESLKDI